MRSRLPKGLVKATSHGVRSTSLLGNAKKPRLTYAVASKSIRTPVSELVCGHCEKNCRPKQAPRHRNDDSKVVESPFPTMNEPASEPGEKLSVPRVSPLWSVHTDSFAELLKQLGISVIVSTYQARFHIGERP